MIGSALNLISQNDSCILRRRKKLCSLAAHGDGHEKLWKEVEHGNGTEN